MYDGTGGPPFQTDIGIADERIALVRDLSGRDAVTHIPVHGLAIAPGFIDVHAHTDELWLVDGRCIGKVAQGVTTEIGGNCGTSVAPLAGDAFARRRESAATYGLEVGWTSFDEFFRDVERSGVALNVASLVGLGTTRSCVAGPAARRLEPEERAAQARLVREAVEQGAVGCSSGLIYEPGRYADLEELAECAAAAAAGGAPLYASHLRDEGDGLLDAVAEALAVGARAGVRVQCSHHKAQGRRNHGRVHASLERIDAARARGEAVEIDAYPYVASWTDLATALPEDVRRGGRDATLERLRDPEVAATVALRMKIAHDPLLGGDPWETVLVTDVGSERNANLAGMRIPQIAERWRLSPERAAIRLLVEEGLEVQCAFFTMSEDDVATVLSADFCSIGSDASARAFDGITARGVPHPRTYGCFPRVFGRFVRGRRILAMEEAIRRMTSFPAQAFGLRERGVIAPGNFADLVVFDPERIVDRATYDRPYVPPDGVRDVFVNGVAVLRDGAITGARSGRVLRSGR